MAKRGDLGGAVGALESVCDEHPSAELLGELAELAFRNHMWEVAVRALRNLAELIPDDACTQRNLAAAYFNSGDHQNAQRSALHARALEPVATAVVG